MQRAAYPGNAKQSELSKPRLYVFQKSIPVRWFRKVKLPCRISDGIT
jgi:hypothetical protein